MKHKFLIIAGLADSLLNFRGPLITALLARGLEVHAVAPDIPADSAVRRALEARGVVVHEVRLRRAGMNALSDVVAFLYFWGLMRRIRPTYVLGYTIKPVIYGSIAAWLAGVPNRFALVTGLGYAFQGEGERRWLQFVVQALYSTALRRVNKVFFQNRDDEALFRAKGIIGNSTLSVVVNGSGVDLATFACAPLPMRTSFLLIARLLGDKGVREYAEAAHLVREANPDVDFKLVGWLDENPDAITEGELDRWVKSGTLDFRGRLTDVRPALAESTVYVLPSYREGTPRTVLEAMAVGRAVITTDAPGCRETVTDGDNGFLVPVKSVQGLVDAMQKFIDDPSLAARMGERGRNIVEDKYDVHKVNAVMLTEMGIK